MPLCINGDMTDGVNCNRERKSIKDWYPKQKPNKVMYSLFRILCPFLSKTKASPNKAEAYRNSEKKYILKKHRLKWILSHRDHNNAGNDAQFPQKVINSVIVFFLTENQTLISHTRKPIGTWIFRQPNTVYFPKCGHPQVQEECIPT